MYFFSWYARGTDWWPCPVRKSGLFSIRARKQLQWISSSVVSGSSIKSRAQTDYCRVKLPTPITQRKSLWPQLCEPAIVIVPPSSPCGTSVLPVVERTALPDVVAVAAPLPAKPRESAWLAFGVYSNPRLGVHCTGHESSFAARLRGLDRRGRKHRIAYRYRGKPYPGAGRNV